MKTRTSSRAGFTLVEIMIVVAIIGLLCAIAVPNFIKARTVSQADACIANLRQIDAGVQQWALEKNQKPTANVTLSDCQPYIGRGSAGTPINVKGGIVCPAGGTYAVTTVSAKPTCTMSSLTSDKHVLPN